MTVKLMNNVPVMSCQYFSCYFMDLFLSKCLAITCQLTLDKFMILYTVQCMFSLNSVFLGVYITLPLTAIKTEILLMMQTIWQMRI